MRNKTTLVVILILCVSIGVGVVIRHTFLGRSVRNTNEGDVDEEVNPLFYETSQLTMKGILGESPLTGKNVTILIPIHATHLAGWSYIYWFSKPDKHYFYVLYTNESSYEELLLGFTFRPSESLLDSYVEVGGTLRFQRIKDYKETYVLYVEHLEILYP